MAPGRRGRGGVSVHLQAAVAPAGPPRCQPDLVPELLLEVGEGTVLHLEAARAAGGGERGGGAHLRRPRVNSWRSGGGGGGGGGGGRSGGGRVQVATWNR